MMARQLLLYSVLYMYMYRACNPTFVHAQLLDPIDLSRSIANHLFLYGLLVTLSPARAQINQIDLMPAKPLFEHSCFKSARDL